MFKLANCEFYIWIVSALHWQRGLSRMLALTPMSTFFVPVWISAVLACMTMATTALAEGGTEEGGSNELCASENDLAALNARVLQTELMVAALSCDERQQYNNFIVAYRSMLSERSQALQGMFKRAYGAEGTDRLNSFVTKMANNSSQQVTDRGNGYCAYAGELFKEVLANRPSDLNLLTSKPWIEDRHGYRPCVLEASRKPTG